MFLSHVIIETNIAQIATNSLFDLIVYKYVCKL